MKVTQLVKNSALASAMIVSVVAGSLWAQTTAPRPAPTTVPAPTTATAPSDVVAVVNGIPVSAKWFSELLMAVAGRRVFPQALDLVLVQQESAKQQLPMQGPDFEKRVQAEIDRALDALEESGVPRTERGKMIGILLQRFGRTEEEFLISMNVAAGLRRLSQGRVSDPTEEEVKQAFDAMYGPRLETRILTVRNMEDIGPIRKKLEAGQTLESVLQTTQGVQVQARVIPERTVFEQPDMKKLRDAAFATKEKELSSPVPQALPSGENIFHAVYVEKKVAADTTANLANAAVKAKVEKAVRASKEQNWMNNQLRILQQGVNVEIKDPILSRQYEAIYRATTQSTQPATNAATPKK